MRRQAFILALLVLAVGLLVGCGESGQAPSSGGQTSPGNQREVGSTAPAPAEPIVSVREIKESPRRFENQLVRIRGYGTIMATLPLCPGYVGLDTRCQFVDEAQDKIVARASDKLASPGSAIFDEKRPRLFRAYVRVFEGEIGCPGQLRKESFPWLEIVAVEQ